MFGDIYTLIAQNMENTLFAKKSLYLYIHLQSCEKADHLRFAAKIKLSGL